MSQRTRDILAEVANERHYQEGRWGNTADDTKNKPNDFVAYIAAHSTRWFQGGFDPYPAAGVDAFRDQMIKVAALAVAAVESVDRQRDANGRTFYEQEGTVQ